MYKAFYKSRSNNNYSGFCLFLIKTTAKQGETAPFGCGSVECFSQDGLS